MAEYDGCPDGGHTGGADCNPAAGEGGSPCSLNNCPGCSKCEHLSCFPYFALVETPHGRIPIGDLSEGEMILSYSNGILVPRLITRKLVHGEATLVQINFEAEGNSLLCTASHSFLTDRGWLAIKEVNPGDKIVRVNVSSPEQSLVKSIVHTGKREPVFNLYSQAEHNFIVDGCVAHNFTHFRFARVVLHNLFIDSFVLSRNYLSKNIGVTTRPVSLG